MFGEKSRMAQAVIVGSKTGRESREKSEIEDNEGFD